MTTDYQHWHLNQDEQQVVWLAFDRKDHSTNALSNEVLDEFSDILTALAKQESLQGLVIYSAKANGFIAGADIEQFADLSDVDIAAEFLEKGQKVFAQLEALDASTIAMISGFCLGGGLELALACDYRIGLNDDKTRLGLPEVKLGIHPGWGGSVRLPRLIGAPAALNLMLNGHTVRAKVAKRLGLLDEAVPERQLRRAVQYYLEHKPAKHKPSGVHRVWQLEWIRLLFGRFLRYKVKQKVQQEHYPAPIAMIRLWERYGAKGEKAYSAELNSVVDVIQKNTTPKHLVRIFFLQERLKSLSKGVDFKANHVHVIGGGTMGGDIAAWCALQGMKVTLQDREAKFLAPAFKRAYKTFKKKLKNPRDIQAAMDRLIPDLEGEGIAKADVIIEAIFENLEAKQALFKEIEGKARAEAILATNTSSIPLDEISKAMKNKKRLVGIHFFNPVAQMLLVEVVAGEKTDKTILGKATAFVRQIDRLPLPVKSSPGFLVNRVLMPYLMEAMALLEEGFLPDSIDKAATDFGMPMGPIELADRVGLDVCLSVAENLLQHFGGSIPKRLGAMVERGELGAKSGRGFYRYKNNKRIKDKTSRMSSVPKDLAERMVMRMINEAAACLREGVVQDADLLDAGMVFGTGFAPFRGGPMQYAHDLGKKNLSDTLQSLEHNYGERFKADKEWEQLCPE